MKRSFNLLAHEVLIVSMMFSCKQPTPSAVVETYKIAEERIQTRLAATSSYDSLIKSIGDLNKLTNDSLRKLYLDNPLTDEDLKRYLLVGSDVEELEKLHPEYSDCPEAKHYREYSKKEGKQFVIKFNACFDASQAVSKIITDRENKALETSLDSMRRIYHHH
ncbi:MAG: hypothetical protein C5B59_12680 [Bacteroidetes bacterium]|nr:MAG: hypothetical protein C5B59_12680 [Bacteroidota bacterium]